MNGYLKVIASVLVIIGVCFGAYFHIDSTYASKKFVLTGFQEFQQNMEMGRLISQRDSLTQLEMNIRWHLYNNPNDQGALQHLDEVRRQISDINSRINEMNTRTWR
jgi:hypothetical protein